MLQDVANTYIQSEKAHGEERDLFHYNCAQTLLYSCDDYYKLGLDEQAKKMVVPFGGGFYKERACGVLTGGLMAIGVLLAKDHPTDNALLKEVSRAWVEQFESHFGSIECGAIKKTHRHPEEGCGPVMLAGAALLEELLNDRIPSEEGTD